MTVVYIYKFIYTCILDYYTDMHNLCLSCAIITSAFNYKLNIFQVVNMSVGKQHSHIMYSAARVSTCIVSQKCQHKLIHLQHKCICMASTAPTAMIE